ncbi:MAG: hypothetical protein AB9856_17925 [Cellulosilyticaceae bacterium]
MLSKKQYYNMLLASIVVFILVFMGAYLYTQYASKENVKQTKRVIQKQSVDTLQNIEATPSVKGTATPNHVITINPATKIVVDLVNSRDELVKTDFLESATLLGYTREDLDQHFKGYEIKEFTDRKLVLEKRIEDQTKVSQYKMGCQGDGVGIVVLEGTEKKFIPIGITLDDFSVQTGQLLKSEALEITTMQKQMLEKDPYYIEQILQSYNE